MNLRTEYAVQQEVTVHNKYSKKEPIRTSKKIMLDGAMKTSHVLDYPIEIVPMLSPFDVTFRILQTIPNNKQCNE